MDSWTEEKLPKRRGPSPWVIGGVIAICALFLAAFAAMLIAPIFLKRCSFTSTSKVVTDLTQIDSALEEYSRENAGRYPESLQALITPDPNGHTFIKGTRIPKDPWGNEYLYDPPEPGRPDPRVYTYGKDGVVGGEGDDADVDALSLREGRDR